MAARRIGQLLLALAAWLAAGACISFEVARPQSIVRVDLSAACMSSADCLAGQTCFGARCVNACDASHPCDVGSCVDGLCDESAGGGAGTGTTGPTGCQSEAQCAPLEACTGGACGAS